MRSLVLLSSLLIACGDNSLRAIANRPPVAVLDAPDTAALGELVIFDASRSSDPDGDALTFAWDFGDGANASGEQTTHAYDSEGTFDVRLTVSDSNDLTKEAWTQIGIGTNNAPPTAAFTAPASGFAGMSITFDGSASTDPDGSIVTYTWAFGDGTNGSGATVQKSFAVGSYEVTLTVEDDAGATDSIMHPISIAAPSYDGTWDWGLVNQADVNDANCGPFQASVLAIAVSGTSITVTEKPGSNGVVYTGTLTGAHFTVTNQMSMGLGSQTIDATFTSPTHFDGTYRVVASLAGCDRTRAVYGDKRP